MYFCLSVPSSQVQYFVPHSHHLLLEIPDSQVVNDMDKYLGPALFCEMQQVILNARTQQRREYALSPVMVFAGAVVLLQEESDSKLCDGQPEAD